MEKNVPTIIKSLLQSAALLGLPYVPPANSTLNQKLNIQSGLTLNPNEYPTTRVMVIGIGGTDVQTGNDGIPYTRSFAHKPTDTGLFQELPFLVRPIASDISPAQRANYRLRKLVTVGPNNYFAYYGKLLDFESNVPVLQKRTVQPDGSESILPFVPGAGDLSPRPTILVTGQPLTTNGEYVTSSTKLDFIFNAQDVLEILNASMLLYGDENHAVISEMALCSCVDREISVTLGSVPATYDEAIVTQVMSFLTTNFPAPSFSQGMKYSFDLGHSEALLSLIP